MSYTPHEWQNDELITAAKMNNIEEGIAEGGGGGGICLFAVTTENFPSSFTNFMYFTLIEKTGDTYSIPYTITSWAQNVGAAGNLSSEAYWPTPFPVPTFDDVYLAIGLVSGVTLESSSGGISSTPIIVEGAPYYIVTGDFKVSLRGWL